MTTTEEELHLREEEKSVKDFLRKSDLKMTRPELIQFLADRDGDFCFICKKGWDENDEVTIDHWIPLARGGTWHLDNLRLAHKPCNARKGDRMPSPDGTLPPHPKDLLGIFETRADKSNRKPVCQTCESGRLLFMGETCPDCGSGPQPSGFPRAYKKEPKECSHGWVDPRDHCWFCTLGFVQRRPAIETVLGVDELHKED